MCTRDDSAVVVKEKQWNGEVIIVLCCIEMLFLQITYWTRRRGGKEVCLLTRAKKIISQLVKSSPPLLAHLIHRCTLYWTEMVCVVGT